MPVVPLPTGRHHRLQQQQQRRHQLLERPTPAKRMTKKMICTMRPSRRTLGTCLSAGPMATARQ